MKLQSIEAIPLRLPFREEFRIARGAVGSPEAGAPHVYVRVTADNGAEGWGEGRPSPRWSYETPESVVSTIRGYLAPVLVGRDPWDLQGLHRAMDGEIAPGISIGSPVAKCAVDMAVHDLLAKYAGVSLCRFLGGGGESVALSFMISVASPQEAESRAARAWGEGFRAFKVKVGSDPKKDLEILRVVKEAAPDAFLWADANQGYDAATAAVQVRAMEALGVDVLEQPVPANDWTGMARIARDAALPIAVDEGIVSPTDLVQLIRLEAADTLVVKLSKMAGLYRGTLCTRMALEAGMGLLGSGLTESRLGLAASIHLMGAFGVPFADLNGPQFLADDPVAEGSLRLEPGRAFLPENPGIGIKVDAEKLAKYRVE
jgi:L-alanine-DL-glutamate epimerase-like enolase superfamily enzyme